MKIKSIEVSNFQGIESLKLNMPAIGAYVAKNGAGKSSLLRSIRALLTDNVPEHPVRDGEEKAKLTMTIHDELTKKDVVFSKEFNVGKPNKCYVNNKVVTLKVYFKTLEDVTGLDLLARQVTTSQELAESMKPEDLMQTLMDRVPHKTTGNKVRGYITDITPEADELLKLYLPNDGDEEFLFAPWQEKTYASLFENRAAAKRALTGYEQQMQGWAEEKPVRPLADVQAELDRIKGIENSGKAVMEAHRLYKQQTDERARALQVVEDMERELSALKSVAIPNPMVKAKAKEELDSTLADIAFQKETLATIMANVNRFQVALTNLERPVCPLSDSLVCTTDKTKVRQELEQALEDNRNTVDAINKYITEKETESVSIRDRIEDAEKAERAWTAKKALIDKIAALKKSVPSVPIPPTTSLEEAETDFSAKKKELAAELAYAQAYAKNQELLSDIASTKDNLAVLGLLCAALAPKGEVATKIQEDYLEIFEAAINPRAAMISGKDVQVKLSAVNGVVFSMSVDGGKTFRHFNELSHGEQIIALFLLLDLFNQLFGTRLLFLDDLNHLDADSFKALFDIVTSPAIASEYDHILLCSAETSDFAKVAEEKASSGALVCIP